jgi:HPt (histidine-containing phosphotransfer) domain-containing protein
MMSNELSSTPAPSAKVPLPGLNAEALARLTELDPKGESRLLARVLGAFQSSAARLMPQLEAAYGAHDHATIRLVAHTLKSSSASIGALKLSQVCAEVEMRVRTEAAEPLLAHTLDPLLHTLRGELAAALNEIQRLLDSPA